MDKKIETEKLDAFAKQLEPMFRDVEPPASLQPDQLDRILKSRKPAAPNRKRLIRSLAAAAVFVLLCGAAFGWILPSMRAKSAMDNAAVMMEPESAPPQAPQSDTILQESARDEAGDAAENDGAAKGDAVAGEVEGSCVEYVVEEKPDRTLLWVLIGGGCVLVAAFGAGFLIRLKRK